MIIDLMIAMMEHGVQLTEADKVRPAMEEKGKAAMEKKKKGFKGVAIDSFFFLSILKSSRFVQIGQNRS